MGKVIDIVNEIGQNVGWFQRQGDGSFLDKGLKKASVQPANMSELIVEAGYTSVDYQQVFAGFTLAHKDRLTIDGVPWEVQPVQHWKVDFLSEEYWSCLVRRVILT